MATNWAGNYTYGATEILSPRSLEELQEMVAKHPRVRALGSRHSFTDLTDTDGVLLTMHALPAEVEIDESARSARVGGGLLYGEVATSLQQNGWALGNLASLPHISVAGAVATGTHGSGIANKSLSAAVSRIEILGADGEIRSVARGDADFPGSVVSLGALGIVTALHLDIEPTYEVSQTCFLDLPWEALAEHFDDVAGAAYSVSVFTNWGGAAADQVWLKSRTAEAHDDFFGARPATGPLHMLAGGNTDAVTEQGGRPGPWHQRLPHFRMEHTPSNGAEIQSEYLLPRERAAEAITAVRAIGDQLAAVLQVAEIRTVAADDQWLSPAYERDSVALHFTWTLDTASVNQAVDALEAAVLPLGARPHWGKWFNVGSEELVVRYPRLSDFAALQTRVDPEGKFRNAFLDRVLAYAR